MLLFLTGIANAGSGTRGVVALGDAINAESVPVSEAVDIAAKEVYYYQTYIIGKFSNEGVNKEGLFDWLNPSERGLVIDVLPDHIFVPVGGGGNVYGFSVIYKPKLGNVTAEEHRYFAEVEAWEIGSKFDTLGESVLFDIPFLYKAYTRSLDKITVRKMAAAGIYLFYLIRISASTTFSLDEIKNIYMFEDPVAFFDSDIFDEAIETVTCYPPRMMGGPESRSLLALFSKGGLVVIEDGYVYSLYTWEPRHRRLLLWYFIFRGGELIRVHEIVMVSHI